MIASEPPELQKAFLDDLSNDALRALPYLFEFWAMEHQIPPSDEDWRSWVILGGRGASKTRAGAEWVRSEVEGSGPTDPGRSKRVALIGETIDQTREVMVFGESGILACSPPDRMPVWEATRKRLVWPNGAVAQVYSAFDYESLRGPQFDAAWVDEIGCAAIDKATNQPNKFLDPKSSESSVPKYSNGARDDLIQMQYLRAMAEYWSEDNNNPVSDLYAGQMVRTDRMFVWAWDARPYPHFPGNTDLWSDGDNYARGHWISGRVSARSLASVVVEVCARSGVTDVDVTELYGLLRGYSLQENGGARAALQPLLVAFGVDAIERDGQLVFRNRDLGDVVELDDTTLAWSDDAVGLVTQMRDPVAETAGRLQLTFVEADGDYEVRSAEAIFPDEATYSISQSEMPLVLTQYEGRALVERWLSEARVARDSLTFALGPSAEVRAGDVVSLACDDVEGNFRIDRIEDAGLRLAEAVRVEPALYQSGDTTTETVTPKPVTPALPVWPLMMDLPLLLGTELPDAPYVAAASDPWPGDVAVYSSNGSSGWSLDIILEQSSVMGVTQTTMDAAASGLWDRGAGLDVQIVGGDLASVTEAALMNGANSAAIVAADGSDWEIFQYRDAELIDTDTWQLSMRLRGQRGTAPLMPASWPVGSYVVLLDSSLTQIELASALRGLDRSYRIGPATKAVDHSSFTELSHASQSVGLRPFI